MPPSATPETDDTAPGKPAARHFKELVSFRMNMLASTWTRLAAESNERDFQLDAREWRIIGMLGTQAPMSLQGLAKEVNVDKSQASRSVSALIERGLLQRDSDASDGRGVQLSLTRQGLQLYRKVFPKAVKRNEELLSVLSPDERAVFDRALDLLTEHAQATLSRSREAGKRVARKNTA
ncbi:MarR family transcriptional regulator [Bordetella ansorpii]|uniref:MarR family transcriptional regulator n=1 Tax=Bordetella ansorpii TaxID=288768 RepID=A0A157SPX9_9BORD|nr:MarR family transcriptional regulator [Bordetella ansorpii]SAI72467.1 MarR family transcriptional regulator [Bordetella ansorpii]